MGVTVESVTNANTISGYGICAHTTHNAYSRTSLDTQIHLWRMWIYRFISPWPWFCWLLRSTKKLCLALKCRPGFPSLLNCASPLWHIYISGLQVAHGPEYFIDPVFKEMTLRYFCSNLGGSFYTWTWTAHPTPQVSGDVQPEANMCCFRYRSWTHT